MRVKIERVFKCHYCHNLLCHRTPQKPSNSALTVIGSLMTVKPTATLDKSNIIYIYKCHHIYIKKYKKYCIKTLDISLTFCSLAPTMTFGGSCYFFSLLNFSYTPPHMTIMTIGVKRRVSNVLKCHESVIMCHYVSWESFEGEI